MSGKHIRGLLLKSLMALVCCTLALAVCEVLWRTVVSPLLEKTSRPDAWPIFYRLPDKPVGNIYFCRNGPAYWSGRILHDGLKLTCGVEDYYTNEPAITVSYDADGFRNPPELADWDVVVAGDSCVELGHLPDADLFTSRFARKIGGRVKNLGATGAAPFSYLYCLASYGRAPSARHAFMAFFEGNDIDEMVVEKRALDRWLATGRREYRRGTAGGSLLGAAVQGAVHLRRAIRARQAIRACAVFASEQGPIPVTLDYAPPGRSQLTEHERDLLDTTIASWGETARKFGMTPWVLYMPCKRRVLGGALQVAPRTPPGETAWLPGDLPAFVGELCRKHGVEFVDPTPALLDETRRGRLTFNPIWDTHMNGLGAAVVADVMANRYAEWSGRNPERPAMANTETHE